MVVNMVVSWCNQSKGGSILIYLTKEKLFMKWPNVAVAHIRRLRNIERQPGNRILTLCHLAPHSRPKPLPSEMFLEGNERLCWLSCCQWDVCHSSTYMPHVHKL